MKEQSHHDWNYPELPAYTGRGENTDVILGMDDSNLGDKPGITPIATGFEHKVLLPSRYQERRTKARRETDG